MKNLKALTNIEAAQINGGGNGSGVGGPTIFNPPPPKGADATTFWRGYTVTSNF